MVSQHQVEGGEWMWPLVSHALLVAAAQRQIGPDSPRVVEASRRHLVDFIRDSPYSVYYATPE